MAHATWWTEQVDSVSGKTHPGVRQVTAPERRAVGCTVGASQEVNTHTEPAGPPIASGHGPSHWIAVVRSGRLFDGRAV